MKTKELKIQAPEGYEIDKENSTFECIKFRPIKKNISYNDICYMLFKDKNSCYITTNGNIIEDTLHCDTAIEKNNATNRKQLEKILALNQLLNIAEYYNRNTKQKEFLYRIVYSKFYCSYFILTNTSTTISTSTTTGVMVLFNNKEDAQAVMDNPNFREILDTVYKN
nr:MAG TPA: hypothetical protein [Bacteriophage sp.]